MAESHWHYDLVAVRHGWVFVAGQTGEDASGALGDYAQQTTQAIQNVADILAQHGAALGEVRPPRTTVGITPFAGDQLVEIEATAFIGG